MRKFMQAAQPASGIFLAMTTAVVGYVLRHFFIESNANGATCAVDGPWWCAPRTALIFATEWKIIGGLALVLALMAVLMTLLDKRRVGLAMAAMALGGPGFLLYNASLSAIAVVFAGLVLAQTSKSQSYRTSLTIVSHF